MTRVYQPQYTGVGKRHAVGRTAKFSASSLELAPDMTKPLARPDQLTEASPVGASRVFLRFADGRSGTWSFRQLELDMGDMKPATIKASTSGAFMEVRSKRNEKVKIDASSLRAAVDPVYNAELEKAFLAIRGPLEDLIATAPERQPGPPRVRR